jgi:antitoxin component of RelBE/YafQ-DinJ toxin-antitoxin module
MSRINIEIPNEEHQKLKIIAAATSTSIKDIVVSAIQEKIHSQLYRKPNELTLQAFEETDTGKGITKHKNLKDLFDDLGLNGDEKH